jgi:hypothetical protein
MGCILFLPAIGIGDFVGGAAGFSRPQLLGTPTTGGSASCTAALAGAVLWSLHRYFPGNIWTEGPGMGDTAVPKAVLCGTGAGLMCFAAVATLKRGPAWACAFCVLVVVLNAWADTHSADTLLK